MGTRIARAAWMAGLALIAACDSSLSYYDKVEPPVDPTVPTTASGTASTAESPPTTPPTSDTTEPTSSTTTSTSTSTDTGTPATTTTTTTPWANGDPSAPPPWSDANPPPLVLAGPCLTVGTPTSVPDGSGEVVVESHSDNLESKDLEAPVSGWFDLYDTSMANDGLAETNEIAKIRISNAVWPGDSVYANCGTDYVGPDPDNVTDPGATLEYLGTFWFEAGTNTLDLEHFCPSIRAGLCPGLEDLSDPDSTCASGDDNDVAMPANDLCLVEPTP